MNESPSLSSELSRKFLHTFGSLIGWIYLFAPLSKSTTVFILLCLLILLITIEQVRKKFPSVNVLFIRYFGFMMRQKERDKVSGATYFLIGTLLVIALFPKNIAVAAIFYLSYGDTMAAMIGINFGKIKFMDKTLEGSLACFFTCFITGLFFFNPMIALFGAVCATVSELLPLPVNDNITIPLLSAIGLYLII